MQVEVKEGFEYPCLMIGEGDVIVFMAKPPEGTVIRKGYTSFDLGSYRTDWHMPSFTPFNGSITLKN